MEQRSKDTSYTHASINRSYWLINLSAEPAIFRSANDNEAADDTDGF